MATRDEHQHPHPSAPDHPAGPPTDVAPVPEANRPGHHPDHEQDKPADAVAAKLGIPHDDHGDQAPGPTATTATGPGSTPTAPSAPGASAPIERAAPPAGCLPVGSLRTILDLADVLRPGRRPEVRR